MHYLVTGGAGFIGSHLSDGLLAAGHSLSILDDLSTGKTENIPAGATLIKGDITTPGIFDALIANADGVFHLAAIASVQMSKEQWQRTHQVNLGGTIALFDAIARSGKKIPVVYASSAAVYGTPDLMPISETTLCAPLSAYGADKLACDMNAKIASDIHGIPTIGARFSNIYGPRQDPHSPYSGVISIFAGRMKRNEPIIINGDGEQTRDFVFVGDVVEALTRSMQALQNNKLLHGVFNVCTGTQTTINQLADVLREIIGSTSTISHGLPREGDIRDSLGDFRLAKEKLGFIAGVPLETGLKQTVEFL